MNVVKALAGGFAAGATVMYFADPYRGRRRRMIARDKVGAGWRDVVREFDKAGRDLRNRGQGVASTVRALASRSEADEPVIEQRVRSRIGRAVSHPHAISVAAEPGGRVILTGPVLADEVAALVKCVAAVQGVTDVVNQLDVHQERDIDALQGGRPRGERSGIARQSWTPALRVLAGTLGGTALISGMRRNGPLSQAAALAGGALLARAVCNKDFGQIFGVGGARTVEFDKAIHIVAPVEEVYGFWSRLENFSKFMAHVKEVRDLGNGKSRWTAGGPAGIPVSWDAEIVEQEKNERLAWRSVAGSVINTDGVVRFEPAADGGTRVMIHVCYSPPAGMLGHGVAWLFGADPKSEIDDDMVRLKSLLEIGKTRANGSTVWRDELQPT